MKYKPQDFETVLDEWTEGDKITEKQWFVLVKTNSGILIVKRWSRLVGAWMEDERGTYVLRRLEYWRQRFITG